MGIATSTHLPPPVMMESTEVRTRGSPTQMAGEKSLMAGDPHQMRGKDRLTIS
jgi:hypothetical protein